jgi:thiol-disulfide isomerase/thioredoxin/predicted negative regulator of RcsB-dependent stress response
MKRNQWMSCVAVALAGGLSLNLAAAPSLKVGDAAPKLQTGKWLQGEPVKEFESNKVYLVEFWATWCGPCRVSIPHLNEVQQKFKDKGLVVIGQDFSEEDESLVAPFIKEMGDKMTYRVTLDDKKDSPQGKMAVAWMEAAEQTGIPTAFLVDKKGLIAWIGHPMSLTDELVEDVISGKFDAKKAAELDVLSHDLSDAIRAKEWDKALSTLAQAEKLIPDDERPNLDLPRFAVLLGKKDYDAAYKLASKASEEHKDNVQLQDQMAWMIATSPAIDEGKRDLAVAETLATRANAASKEENPTVLDTLGRVLFMRGKKDEAIAIAEKALKAAPEQAKEFLQKTLDSYKKGELPKDD